jgi:type II secretory pathway pseudopilin PulG
MKRHAGFSLLELLLALIFLAVAAWFAIPYFGDTRQRERATSVVRDVEAISAAASAYFTDRQTWPPEYQPGVVPVEMVPYLPKGFRFTHSDRQYDYEIRTPAGGTPREPRPEDIMAIAVTLNDARLVEAVRNTTARAFTMDVTGSRITFRFIGTPIH